LITVIARDSGFSAPRRMGSDGGEGGREGQCARRGAGQSIEEGRDAEVARRKAVQPIEEGGEEGEGKCRAHKAPQPKEERDGLRGRGLEWQQLAAAEIRGAHGGLPGRGGDLDVEAALELGAGPSVSRAAGPAPVGLRVAHRDEGTAFAATPRSTVAGGAVGSVGRYTIAPLQNAPVDCHSRRTCRRRRWCRSHRPWRRPRWRRTVPSHPPGSPA